VLGWKPGFGLVGRKAAERAQKFLCRTSGAQFYFTLSQRCRAGLISDRACGSSIIGAKEIKYAERF
jgi:hypothetical protein